MILMKGYRSSQKINVSGKMKIYRTKRANSTLKQGRSY